MQLSIPPSTDDTSLPPPNPLLQQNKQFVTMSSDSPLGIDKVFLDSCKEVSEALSLRSSHSSTYKLVEPNLDKDKEGVVSVH
ncbi:hypothetical protein FRC20_001442 [Serendipita sp. 405]|nr:hypothetical protein FRC15_002596 [Serendipita sp. 397]KAG8852837.1 hypothetical protein FRC20_001442 [Serendipita sp. 405]